QPTDGQGQPLGGVIPLPIPQFIEYTKALQEIKHNDEKHATYMDFVTTMKSELPRISKALDRQSKKGESKGITPGAGSTKEVEQAVSDMDVRRCQYCGTPFSTPKGMTQVICPNPNCPSHQGGE
ncbi:unnamed protein product, partial [marine sediment metagenome]